jgi:hypothetical protein
MKDYIKLNVLEGSLQVTNENQIPVPKENEIIYDTSALFEKPLEKSEIFKLDEFAKLYKESLKYVKERDMEDYGKGLFTKGRVPRGEIFLPYTGLYISPLMEKEHIVGELSHSRYNLRTGHQLTCLTKDNLGLAHSAQHLPTPENRKNDSAICANLMITLVHIKIKYNKKVNYLHLIVLRNEEDLKTASLLGYDYGFIYWKHIKSAYVEWDAKGRVVNKIAMSSMEFKGENLIVGISQNPKTICLNLPELYMVIFPKGIREDLFQPDKSQKNLPVILVPGELVKWVQDKHADNKEAVLELSIVKFLQANNIKPFFKDSQPKYVLNNDILYLGTEFLENLTVYELEKLIQALNIPEIIFINGNRKDAKEENTKISGELSELFEILSISEITADSSGQKLESPGSSKFFKPADNQPEASHSKTSDYGQKQYVP